MSARQHRVPPTIEGVLRERVKSARAAVGSVSRSVTASPGPDVPRIPAAVEIALYDLVGFAEAVVELLDPPAAPDRPAITLRGTRVEIPTSAELDADPRIDGFMRVAAFVGASGRYGGVDAEALLREVGRIIASVQGVPNPLAEDTEQHYRREALARLTRRQRGRLGMRGEDVSEVGK